MQTSQREEKVIVKKQQNEIQAPFPLETQQSDPLARVG